SVLALADPQNGIATDGNSNAQIRIDSGTSINLAGSDVELPMSANLLSIQLLANELANDPAQRTGALHGQTVIVDTRAGDPPLINPAAWTAALGTIQYNVAQRTSAGGSAQFESEGDIVLNSGASINVSGGQWTYDPGVVQTSQLVGANGQLYPISTANPLLTYTGVLNPTYTLTYNKWGVQTILPTPGQSQQQSGYVQGQSAGAVQFAASSMALAGSL